MLRLQDWGVWCYVAPGGVDAMQAYMLLEAMLVVPCPEGASHPWADIDGQIHFLQQSAHGLRFPRGFAPEIVARLQQHGVDVQWTRQVRHPERHDNRGWQEIHGRLLNDWQRKACQTCYGQDEGILHLYPRFGKSYVLAAAWVARGRPRAIILTPRADVVRQGVEEMTEFLKEPVGHVCTEIGPPNIQRYTFVSPPSLVKDGSIRPEYVTWLSQMEAVYFDECHIAGAQMRAINYATQQRFIQWALSATPFVNDPLKDRDLVGWFGPVRMRMDAKRGADLGLIASVRVRWYDVHFNFPTSLESTLKAMHPSVYYRTYVVENAWLTHHISALARYHMEKGDRVVIFVDRVDHGRRLADQTEGLVPNVGPVSKTRRAKIQEDFNSGAIRGVAVTKRWREGMTLHTDVIINAEGLMAEHVQEQRYGRGLLPKEDGRPLLLYDFAYHDKPRRTLLRHSVERARHYTRTGWEQENVGQVTAPMEVPVG